MAFHRSVHRSISSINQFQDIAWEVGNGKTCLECKQKANVSQYNTYKLKKINADACHTSGLRLKAFAGFPTQRKSKIISFIAKSKRS